MIALHTHGAGGVAKPFERRWGAGAPARSAAEDGFRAEHPPRVAEVLHRALATLRREPGVTPLQLPGDLRAVPPALWVPLAVIRHLDEEPADHDPARLANAVRTVVAWANDVRAPRTALAVAAAGAELLAALPSPALLAARAARALGRLDEAEAWLAAALRRAQAVRDTDTRLAAATELVDLGRDAARHEGWAANPSAGAARRRPGRHA